MKKIFTKEYWSSARNELKTVKSLMVLSMLLALQVASELIVLPSGFTHMGISLTYIFLAISCMKFGPTKALMIGAVGDLIGAVLIPKGTFFPGYTLSAMFGAFICGICFYKSDITLTRVFICRILISLIANVLLGSLWYSIISGIHMDILMVTSFAKNLTYLIPQTLVLFVSLKAFKIIEKERGI